MSDWVKALFVFLCVAVVLFFVYYWIYPVKETSKDYHKDYTSLVSAGKETSKNYHKDHKDYN